MNVKDIPLYRNVYLDILDKIQLGVYKKDELLPSETELQEKYQVSRITIRRAVEDLQRDGFVIKKPGVGTIITNDKITLNLNSIKSFSLENKNESSELVSFKKIIAPDKVKKALNLDDLDKVYQIERIRKVNGSNIGFHRAFIPERLTKLSEDDFISCHSSLYKILESQNINITHGYETIESINSNKSLSELLKISTNTAMLYKERVSSTDYEIVEYVEIYYIGSVYKYYVELKNMN